MPKFVDLEKKSEPAKLSLKPATGNQVSAERVKAEAEAIRQRLETVMPTIAEMDSEIRLYSTVFDVWFAKLRKQNKDTKIEVIFAHPAEQAKGVKFEVLVTSHA
jgi:hypothetical protein